MTVITGVSGERVCDVDDVPLGEGREATVHGRRVAVFHTEDGWYAVDAACPHMGGPLADGIVCDRAVICPLHDRRYDLATCEPLGLGDTVAAHSVRVRGDRVFFEVVVPVPVAA